MPESVKDYQMRLDQLKKERQGIDAKCKAISQYMAPDLGKWPEDNRKPDSRNNYSTRGGSVLNSTGVSSLETATNGIHSGLTPPSRPWFRLAFQDQELNEYGPAKEWLEVLTQRVYSILRDSNFYSAIHSDYAEILAFATNCLYMERDRRTGVRFRNLTFGEYWISCDSTGRPDTLYRTTYMSARQMFQKFGKDKLSTQVQTALDKEPYKPFEVIHAVQPRKERNTKQLDKLNMAWESMWFEQQNENDEQFLSKGGYPNFPYAVGRWNVVASNSYGSNSPGWKILTDVKGLQDYEKTSIMIAHREANPPLKVPSNLAAIGVNAQPGGMNYMDASSSEGLKRLYEFQFNLEALIVMIQRTEQRILKGCYNDLFMMIDALERQAGGVTATQIMEMQREKLLQLGPFVERQEDEKLDPILQFVIGVILEAPQDFGIAIPPPELQAKEFKIDYISLLAQAQREIGVRTIDATVAFASQAAAINPNILHNVDFDEAIRIRADLIGAPAKMIRGTDEVMKLREAEAKKVQEMQAQQQAMMLAQAGKGLGEIPMDPEKPNVLTQLAKMAGGGSELTAGVE